VLPHLAVHRRRDEHRAREAEVERAQEGVGDSLGRFGQEVRRRGRDAENLALLGQLDVSAQWERRGEELAHDRFAGQRGQGRGAASWWGRTAPARATSWMPCDLWPTR